MSGKQVADTTLEYLGGMGRLKAMINARDWTYDEKGTLQFKFSSYPKANIVRFVLTSMDDYTMEFWKGSKKINSIEGLHFDQLREVFERETGLYLSL